MSILSPVTAAYKGLWLHITWLSCMFLYNGAAGTQCKEQHRA